MRRAALLLVVALGAGVAHGQGSPVLGPDPVAPRALETIRTYTADELIEAAGMATRSGGQAGPVIRKAFRTGGKFLNTAGWVMLGFDAIQGALSWYKGQAESAFKTPGLRDYWSSGPSQNYLGPMNAVVTWTNPNPGPYSPDEYIKLGTIDNQWDGYTYLSESVYCTTKSNSHYSGTINSQKLGRTPLNQDAIASAIKASYEYWMSYCNVAPAKKLADVLRQPGVADEVKTIVNNYYQDKPNLLPSILDPTPNANQMADWPVDPTIDTDGDGFTDADELADKNGDREPDGDPNDPLKFPSGAPTIATRKTWTVMNPDGSKSTITETTYTDGSKKRTTITTKTELTQNPDGTWTKRTTTTTTEESFKPDGTPDKPPTTKQMVEEEQFEAEPLPYTDKESCEAAGGSWSGTVCTKKPEKEEPCPVGYTADQDGRCVKKEDAPVPNDCGVFTVERAVKHLGSFLKDVFKSCRDLGEIWKPVQTAAAQKFPFSLVEALNKPLIKTETGTAGPAIPTNWGYFTVDMSRYDSVWAIAKVLFKTVLGVAFLALLLNKLMGQVIIS